MGILICCILLSAGFAGGFLAGAVLERTPATWLCDYGEEASGALEVGRRCDHGEEASGALEVGRRWRVASGLALAAAALPLWLRLERELWSGGPAGGPCLVVGPPAPGDVAGALILWAAAMGAVFLLLIVAAADGRRGIIPDQYTAALAMVGAAVAAADLRRLYLGAPEDALVHLSYWSPIAGALLCGGGLLLLSLLAAASTKNREAIGFGDVKLFAALGLLLGPQGGLTVLLLSFLLSGAAFTVLLLAKKIRRGDSKPFGPYIALSAVLYICF